MKKMSPNDPKYGISVSSRVPVPIAVKLKNDALALGITLSKYVGMVITEAIEGKLTGKKVENKDQVDQVVSEITPSELIENRLVHNSKLNDAKVTISHLQNKVKEVKDSHLALEKELNELKDDRKRVIEFLLGNLCGTELQYLSFKRVVSEVREEYNTEEY